MNQFEIADLAWLAGIIDGEGSIGITRGAPYRGSERYRLHIAVTNSSLTLIKRCQDIAGCGVVNTRSPGKGQKKMISRWTAGGTQAQDVIHRVLPFLVEPEKRRRAELALRYPTSYPEGKYRFSKEVQAVRGRVRAEMRAKYEPV